MDRIMIAFSGGVDSSFLLKAATLSGVSEIFAVTGISDSLPEEECRSAEKLAASLNVRHEVVATEEMKNSSYTSNPPNRCYHCKKELFGKLKEIAQQEKFPYILDGTNADDAHDWRPGRQAAAEEGVTSPLLEAGLTKNEIRKLSQKLGLPTWNKPATPCLSSRFPYGQEITSLALDRVHSAELFIGKLGVSELRVRKEGETARIEILPDEFPLLTDRTASKKVADYLKTLGFRHVTLDLQGFRSGSANELLQDKKK